MKTLALCIAIAALSYNWGLQDGFKAAVLSCPEPTKVVSVHSNLSYMDCVYMQEPTYGRAPRKIRVNRG